MHPLLIQSITLICKHIENNSSHGGLADHMFSILGSFISLSGALFIFYLTQRKDKRKEAEKKKDEQIREKTKKDEERTGKLVFFTVLLNNSINIAKTQQMHIQELIEGIEKDKVNFFHTLTIVQNYDLKRICEDLKLEEYFLSYVNKYDKGFKEKAAKEFATMIINLDYLYGEFLGLKDIIIQYSQLSTEYKKSISELVKKSEAILRKLILEPNHINTTFHEKWVKLQQEFIQHNDNFYNLNIFFEWFFTPINSLARENIIVQNDVEELKDIAIYTRDGLQLYQQVKDLSEILLQDMSTILQTVSESIDTLESNSKWLRDNFEVKEISINNSTPD